MTLTNPKPGGHSIGEKLTSPNVDSAFSQLPYAIDGNAGGTYAPTDPIIIGGDGIRVGGIAEGVAERILALEDPPFIKCQVSGSGLAAAAKVTIAEIISKGTWTITSNSLEVPQAGWYAVSFHTSLTTSSVTNPYEGSIFVAVNAVATLSWGCTRWTASASDVYHGSGTGIVKITTPASEKISAHVSGAGTIATTGNADARLLHVYYLGTI